MAMAMASSNTSKIYQDPDEQLVQMFQDGCTIHKMGDKLRDSTNMQIVLERLEDKTLPIIDPKSSMQSLGEDVSQSVIVNMQMFSDEPHAMEQKETESSGDPGPGHPGNANKQTGNTVVAVANGPNAEKKKSKRGRRGKNGKKGNGGNKSAQSESGIEAFEATATVTKNMTPQPKVLIAVKPKPKLDDKVDKAVDAAPETKSKPKPGTSSSSTTVGAVEFLSKKKQKSIAYWEYWYKINEIQFGTTNKQIDTQTKSKSETSSASNNKTAAAKRVSKSKQIQEAKSEYFRKLQAIKNADVKKRDNTQTGKSHAKVQGTVPDCATAAIDASAFAKSKFVSNQQQNGTGQGNQAELKQRTNQSPSGAPATWDRTRGNNRGKKSGRPSSLAFKVLTSYACHTCGKTWSSVHGWECEEQQFTQRCTGKGGQLCGNTGEIVHQRQLSPNYFRGRNLRGREQKRGNAFGGVGSGGHNSDYCDMCHALKQTGQQCTKGRKAYVVKYLNEQQQLCVNAVLTGDREQ